MKMKRNRDHLHQISKCYLSLDQNLFSDKSLCEQTQQQKVINIFEMNQKKNSKLVARYNFNKKIFQKEHKNASTHQSTQKIWLDFVQKTDEAIAKKSKMKSFYDLYRQNLQQKRSIIKYNQEELKKAQNSLQELRNIQLSKKNKIKLKQKSSKSKTIQSSYEYKTQIDELNKKYSALNLNLTEGQNNSKPMKLQQNQQDKELKRFSKVINQKKFHTQGIEQIQKIEIKKEKLNKILNDLNKSERSHNNDNLSEQKVVLKAKKRKCKTIECPEQNQIYHPNTNIQSNQRQTDLNRTKNLKFLLKKYKQCTSHNKQEKKQSKGLFNINNHKEQILTNLNSQRNYNPKGLAHGYAFQALSNYQQKPEQHISLQYRIKSFKKKDCFNNYIPLKKNFTAQLCSKQQANSQNYIEKQQKIGLNNQSITKLKKQNKKKLVVSFKQKQVNMMNGSLSGWKGFSQKFDQPY